jgi:KTSC domain-containing protein
MPAVSSSAMDRVEYDEATRRLDIWFNATGRYTYYGVPLAIYVGLLSASSKGRYFNDHIRDRYG